MRILLVNDDGIQAKGIQVLANIYHLNIKSIL